MPAKFVAEGLISGEGPTARLLAGRREADGKVVFPMPAGPEAKAYTPIELATAGTLWSFTVQRFRPKPPYNGPGDDLAFEPYAVGYVELPGQIIVESRIETDDFQALKIGMPMAFTLQKFRVDDGGSDILTYAFRPV